MPKNNDKFPHLILNNTSTTQPFTAPKGGGGSHAIPQLDRATHGAALKAQIEALKPLATQMVENQREHALDSGLGLQIEFVGVLNVALAFESLGSERGRDQAKHIEVLSLRTEGDITSANVFVPEGKLVHFEKYIEDYLAERRRSDGVAIDHHALLNTISSIRAAEIKALWTDDLDLLPEDQDEVIWWEVWLPVRGDREAVISDFRKLAALAECEVSEHHVSFPERSIVLMKSSTRLFSRSVMMLNCVAELRRAKETADFFDAFNPVDQQQWAAEALQRTTVRAEVDEVPRVCLLDSGVNRGHPLLESLISSNDLHAVIPAWGVDDQANHGSGLAALAAYGDLTDVLESDAAIAIEHRLESVKLTPHQGANAGDEKHHAYLFSEAVSRVEIAEPLRTRAFTSAVTSADARDRGRPSAWSAAVDRLAADYDGEGRFPRLFVLCAGNVRDAQSWASYPASLSSSGILDPGQAWNAITVGAYTEKVNISEADAQGLAPIAAAGGLSPFTRTSDSWNSAWPLKPDVVFEGGNAAIDDLGAICTNSLQLLTAHHRPVDRLFTTTNATSAASALCARMAGQLMANYSDLRPETIRALIVHSAEWTEAMRANYLPAGHSTKADYVKLIRHCGWGVPDLERAKWSASNVLTLVVEDQLRPYQKVTGKGITSRDMNLHTLPWPREELLALPPNTEVELRVTLSYFIEPNPSARGITSKFHYPSHRLRFDVQRPLDATTEDFVARINAAVARDDENGSADPDDSNWLIGERQRHRGSLHQDVWRGTAAELAARGFIAVYPAKGWWRTRPAQERYDLQARYSLVVSIRTPAAEVDIYSPVAQRVAVKPAVAVEVSV